MENCCFPGCAAGGRAVSLKFILCCILHTRMGFAYLDFVARWACDGLFRGYARVGVLGWRFAVLLFDLMFDAALCEVVKQHKTS